MYAPLEWRSVVFSDEKKFNLDGPEGNAYYSHELRSDETFFLRANMVGVWWWFGPISAPADVAWLLAWKGGKTQAAI